MEVHRQLGPGLTESNYEEALCIELTEAGLSYVRQVSVPVLYKGQQIGEHRPDLVVETASLSKSRALNALSASIGRRSSHTCGSCECPLACC